MKKPENQHFISETLNRYTVDNAILFYSLIFFPCNKSRITYIYTHIETVYRGLLVYNGLIYKNFRNFIMRGKTLNIFKFLTEILQ